MAPGFNTLFNIYLIIMISLHYKYNLNKCKQRMTIQNSLLKNLKSKGNIQYIQYLVRTVSFFQSFAFFFSPSKNACNFFQIFAHVNYEKPQASYSRFSQNSNIKRPNHWPEPSCDLMGCEVWVYTFYIKTHLFYQCNTQRTSNKVVW